MKTSQKLGVVIEKDDNGYYAYCPLLEGCQSQGDTMEEALMNIQEAVELYLETMTNEEKSIILSKQFFATSLDVKVA